MMTFKEKKLFHQIHPLKLATDILANVISLCFLWRHELATALAVHFIPPLAVSTLLIRYGSLELYQDSLFGRYVARNMTALVEGVRLLGDLTTMIGAWYQHWLLLAAGFAVILGAWCSGLLPTAQSGR